MNRAPVTAKSSSGRGESASLLVHHWREAGDVARTVHYLLLAAERASRAWAKTEAVSLYTQTLELLPDDDADLRLRVRLLRASTLPEGRASLGVAVVG